METTERSPETFDTKDVSIWLTLVNEHAENDAVSHASAQCPEFAKAIAAGHKLITESGEASGWLCGYCSDVASTVMATSPITGHSVDPIERKTGPAQPKADDWWNGKDADEVERWLAEHTDKVEVGEVTPALAKLATAWAKTYSGTFEFMVDMRAAAVERKGGLSVGQAKGVLNCWRADINRRPKVTAAKPAPAPKAETEAITEDGMYRMPDGTIVKAQFAVHGSGNLYAKKLVKLDEPIIKRGKPVFYEFEMVRGLVRKLTPAMRMTVDEAKEFGQLYGVCCVCAATLTDDKIGGSIEKGIGPVCEGKV